MSKRDITRDFIALCGSIIALALLAPLYINGMSPTLVAAAQSLQTDLPLFILTSSLVLASSAVNLVWNQRIRLPRLLYAGPFLVLLLGLCVPLIYFLMGLTPPPHGLVVAFQNLYSHMSTSVEFSILWGCILFGSLLSLYGSLKNLKEDLSSFKKLKENLSGRHGALLALIVLFAISSLISPYFLQTRNILNILRQVSYTGIIALGMTFVIISGGIDLSVGSLTALLGGIMIVVLNFCVNILGDGWLAIVLALTVGLALGALSGLISGFMITQISIAPFIVTLGTMAIYRSLTLYISNAGEFRSVSTIFPEVGMGYDPLLGIPYPVWAFCLLAIFCAVLLNWTRYGRYTSAIGSNEKVAVYAAIKVNRVRTLAYVLIGTLTAFSSFLLAARLNSISSTNVGINFEMDAIAAVIIGGTLMSGGSGTIAGTVIGAIILGIVNNMLNMLGVSPYLQGMVKGFVIITAVMIQRKKR